MQIRLQLHRSDFAMMHIRMLAVVLLLGAMVMPGCAIHRPVESMRESGDRYFARGEYARAADEYQQITDRYPGDWRAQFWLGQSLLEMDEVSRARRALEVAHSQRPGHSDIADALAEAMFRQGDERQLYEFLNERAQSTQNPTAYLRLAYYTMEMGDPDSARMAIDTAIAVDDGRSVEPYLDAAMLAEQLGDIDLAIRRLRQAYGINPYDVRVRTRLQELGEVPGPTIALPPGR